MARKYENSLADRKSVKKAGASPKKFEGSSADRRADAAGPRKMDKGKRK